MLAVAAVRAQNAEPPSDSGVRFKSGVELVNVTATVSDSFGRFVPGLGRDDFLVYEDDSPVEVLQFSAERVPVSLGIVLDTSGSMAGQKMEEARAALTRFTEELLDRADELFLYRFSNYPGLAQGWTNDRQRILYALDRMTPYGGTAMYDAVERRVPLAQQGRNRKRALVVISDGNDTTSPTDIRDLKQQIRESEVLVYAVGIDGEGEPTMRRGPVQPPPRIPMPIPFPFPGCRAAAAAGRRPRRSADRAAISGPPARRPRERRRAARHDRRQRRAHRDRPRPAGSGSRDRRHRRRAWRAVPYLAYTSPGRKRQSLASNPRRGQRTARIASRSRKGCVARLDPEP